MAGNDTIEDVCWELFGGGCGVLETLDEMVACDRKIRECEAFIPAFREAVAARLDSAKQAVPTRAADRGAAGKKVAGEKADGKKK